MRTITLLALACLLGCSSKPSALVLEDGSPIVGADGRTTQHLGLETMGGSFIPVIPQGTRAPCSQVQSFSPSARHGPREIAVSVYRGNARTVAENQALGRYRVVDPPRPEGGSPAVDLTFGIAGGRITLSARDRASGKDLKLEKVN
jgi:molecular chaperone DnaK (HSP70)